MTARLPSMVEQLLACVSKRRSTIGRPFQEGMRPNGGPARVLAILQAEYPRMMGHKELRAISGLSENQVCFACHYLIEHRQIVAVSAKHNASHKRYQAVAQGTSSD